jgi:hypothetical protein
VQGTVLKRVPVSVMERASSTVTVVPEVPVTQVVDYPTGALVDGASFGQAGVVGRGAGYNQ